MKALIASVAVAVAASSLAGTASWYGEEYRGKPMANGRPFNPDALTAASWFFPLGTRVRVTVGDKTVVVTITDRGPHPRLVREGRTIDLSRAAFARLADTRLGLIPVREEKIR